MASRVVLACWGSFGDLFPTIGIAVELRRRGHRPVVASCPIHRDAVAAAGLDFAPVRPDVDPDDSELIARVMNPARGAEVIVRELLVPALRDSFDDLAAAADGADLLVSHPVTFAAPILAEARGLRWLSTVLAPTSFFSAHDFPLLPPHPGALRLVRAHPLLARGFMRFAKSVTGPWTEPVRDFRESLGLPPGADALYEGQFSPYGTLALFSRVLAAPQPDWPPRTTITGFVFHDSFGEIDDRLQAFLEAGDPPVVFTLGTSAVGAPGAFYRESAAAAHALGCRAVLLVGRRPGNAPPDLPPGVIAVEYAPHAPLFERASAVVHQGGVGTTAQALRAGRPMLVVPHAHDQPDNAARVERFGAGRILPPSRYEASAAVPHLRALTRDARYAARAREAAAVIASEHGTAAAADAIERALA